MTMRSQTMRHRILYTAIGTTALSMLPAPVSAQTAGPDAAGEIAALRQALTQQQEQVRELTRRLDAITAAQPAAASMAAPAAPVAAATPEQSAAAQPPATPPVKTAVRAGFAPGDAPRGISGFKSGFYVGDAGGNNTLNINALLQPRFRYFAPSGTDRVGASDRASNNFDVFLARLYFSGNVVDPSLTYFFTLQGTTQNAPGAPNVTLLDAEIAKTFSPHLKIEAGRYWSAYTYEYFLDIGKYLLPDLSAAEWGFALGRQVGVRASGRFGRLTYRVSLSNPVPGSLSGSTENTFKKLAVIGNLTFDILSPYGYVETDPDPKAAPTPQLSLWVSGMHNPVQTGSRVYNDVAGDKTDGATASLNFRYGRFTLQGSGYYKHNGAREATSLVAAHRGFNSYAWQEQAGFYLIPGKLEAAQRIDGIRWGYRQTGPVIADAASDTQWYAGPDNFGWQHITEYTGGLNYYLHGHNAKAQLQYSYLHGDTFEDVKFSANRLILQTQLAF